MGNMIFIPVGYPIQFKKVGSTYGYEIETIHGAQMLEDKEFMLWTDLLRRDDEYSMEPAVLNSLKEKKAIVYAESENSLFSLLFAYTPIRQGFGGVSNNKYCIVLGEKSVFPTKLQLDLWVLSDGKKTLLDILRILSKEHKIVATSEKEDFVKQLKELISCSLLFLM